MAGYVPIVNPKTGLEHTLMPKVTEMRPPKALLYVGNSFFFFNNGAHRYVKRMLMKTEGAPRCRMTMVAINGASLSWHDVESYFRPNALAAYSFDEENHVVFRDPNEQLWDAVILLDSSQGPIHPELGPVFEAEAEKDAAIVRKHDAAPIFLATWAYATNPEMTAELADATIKVANDNDAIVIPVGLAFALAQKNRPGLNLLIGDNRHPKPEGSYLMACVIIETLFGFNAEKLTFDAEVEPEVAAYLRSIAHETVSRFFGRKD